MFLPSYDSGYAPRDFVPEYPELWDGVVGAWCPSLGATGTNLFDQSGYGNNGTLNGYTLSGAWVNPYVQGLVGSGNASNVSVPNSPNLSGMSQLTLSAWVYPTSFNKIRGICGKWVIGGNAYILRFNYAGNIQFYTQNSLGGMVLLTSSAAVLPNRWSFVAAVYDGAKLRIWINSGFDSASGSQSGNINTVTGMLYIGSDYDGTDTLNGGIDDIQISTRDRSGILNKLYDLGRGGIYTPSSRQASLIPNIGATGNRRRRVIIGAA